MVAFQLLAMSHSALLIYRTGLCSFVLWDTSKTTKRKTRVLNQTLCPRWDETLEWPVDSIQNFAEQALEVGVWDHDSLANDFLGATLVSVSEVLRQGELAGWFQLFPRAEAGRYRPLPLPAWSPDLLVVRSDTASLTANFELRTGDILQRLSDSTATSIHVEHPITRDRRIVRGESLEPLGRAAYETAGLAPPSKLTSVASVDRPATAAPRVPAHYASAGPSPSGFVRIAFDGDDRMLRVTVLGVHGVVSPSSHGIWVNAVLMRADAGVGLQSTLPGAGWRETLAWSAEQIPVRSALGCCALIRPSLELHGFLRTSPIGSCNFGCTREKAAAPQAACSLRCARCSRHGVRLHGTPCTAIRPARNRRRPPTPSPQTTSW
jgi:hypothetical protein